MVNKSLQNLLIGIGSTVIGGLILGVISEIFFDIDWIALFIKIWNFEVSIVYLISVLLFFGIFHFWRVSSIKKIIPKKFETSYFQEQSDAIPESYDHSAFYKEIDKFKYQDVLWLISLPYSDRPPVPIKGIYEGYSKDDVQIDPEPLCPKCNIPLKEKKFGTPFGQGLKWICLNEECDFEKDIGKYFSDISIDALKVWKSQNASNFQ